MKLISPNNSKRLCVLFDELNPGKIFQRTPDWGSGEAFIKLDTGNAIEIVSEARYGFNANVKVYPCPNVSINIDDTE